MVGNGFADNLDDARNQQRFRLVAVGETGIVRHVDISGIGPSGGRFAIHGEPADAGIENEDFYRSFGHVRRSRTPV